MERWPIVLVRNALARAKERDLSSQARVGEVGSSLITDKSNIYSGLSITAACGIGFCAEHSAIAAMLCQGETRIKGIVAVTSSGIIVPPCGRCRELMLQINPDNVHTGVLVGKNRLTSLGKLLPLSWQDAVAKSRMPPRG